ASHRNCGGLKHPRLAGFRGCRGLATISGMTRNQASEAGATAPDAAAPSIAIIGAGIAGLTSAKALQDYGIPWTVFEVGDWIGGNWAFKNPNGRSRAYRRLHIHTPPDTTSFP